MTEKEKMEIEAKEKKEISTHHGEQLQEGVFFQPNVDITEDENALILLADLPGVANDSVDIDLREGVLTLTAKVDPLETNRKLVYKEYNIGGYQRRFSVSKDIDTEKISAKLDNGVLRLTLPKLASRKPRKIEIST